jgi:DNA-binding NarL/FixJ family response regulator
MINSQQKTAVVLDPHPIWLEAIQSILARMDVMVVGSARHTAEALELITTHRPDVLVASTELEDDDPDAITCLRQARERHPALRAIVLSSVADPQHIEAALDAGAVAYVTKMAHPDDLAAAIRQSFEHSVFMAGVRVAPSVEPAAPSEDARGLTRRELEILRLVAEGYSNAQLAKMLWVTEQTVKFHLSNVYRKLDVSNRTEASRWAQVQGLLPAAPAAATLA